MHKALAYSKSLTHSGAHAREGCLVLLDACSAERNELCLAAKE